MERLFKLRILVLFAVFIGLYWQASQNGRYAKSDNSVVDTRTGVLYKMNVPGSCGHSGPGCIQVSE